MSRNSLGRGNGIAALLYNPGGGANRRAFLKASTAFLAATFPVSAAIGQLAFPEKIILSHEEWRGRLAPCAFASTRERAADAIFTGKYCHVSNRGLYRCVCCGSALFHSDDQFASGTGWPAFRAPVAEENIATAPDSRYGMRRSAVTCRKCDAHLGHVFWDGPQPARQRYCVNSTALRLMKF